MTCNVTGLSKRHMKCTTTFSITKVVSWTFEPWYGRFAVQKCFEFSFVCRLRRCLRNNRKRDVFRNTLGETDRMGRRVWCEILVNSQLLGWQVGRQRTVQNPSGHQRMWNRRFDYRRCACSFLKKKKKMRPLLVFYTDMLKLNVNTYNVYYL